MGQVRLSNIKINWKWPVTVSVSKKAFPVFKRALARRWGGDFSTIKPGLEFHGQDEDSNILLFHDFDEAVVFFKRLGVGTNIKTDLLIIFAEYDFFSQRGMPPAMMDRLLRSWIKRCGAAGLYLVQTTSGPAEWYNEFIIALSHNLGVDEAITQSPGQVLKSYVANNLNDHTKLSKYLLEIGKKIGRPSFPDKKEITLHLPEIGSRSMRPKELSKFIRENASVLPYNQESAMASTVKQLSKDIVKIEKAAAASAGASPPPAPAPAPSVSPPPIKKKRSLQAGVFDKKKKSYRTTWLEPRTPYQFHVNIGYGKTAGLTKADKTIPVEDLFADEKIKKITLNLVIFFPADNQQYSKRISLPREGESTVASVPFVSGSEGDIFQAEIHVFHKSKKIQQAVFKVPTGKPAKNSGKKTAEFKTIVLLRQLDDVKEQRTFGASIHLEQKPGQPDKIGNVFQKHKPVELRYVTAIQKLIDKIKNIIEEGALFEEPKAIDNARNVNLLIKLANNGHLLHRDFLNGMELKGPLQLLSNRQEYLPIDFAYCLKPPEGSAKLCPHAKDALLAGKCCGKLKSGEDAFSTVCPFGFWGLSHIVERHQFPKDLGEKESDFILQFEPDDARSALNILNKMIYASTEKVDADVRGSYAAMKKILKQNTAAPVEIKSWKEWKNKVASVKPDTLILIVHVEEDDITGVDKLEIANEDFLPQTQFDERYLNTSDKNNPPPFVILIGCEATNTNAYLFDTVSFIINRGAAMVLSNFTRIKGEMATAIVSELIEILRKEAGKEIRFGEIVLRLKQRLLARGMMMALTLLAHGDADWKIKIA